MIGRRSCIERLVRPRVALVLARRPPSSEPAAAPVGRTVRNEFRLALSLDFSWPTWLVDARSWRLDVQPIASAVSRRRGAPPLALVARRAEVQPMAMADVSRRSAAAGERPPSLRPVRPHDAAVAPAIDRRTSVETTLRDVITRLRTSRAASVLVSRGPLVTPSAGLAAHRAAADRVARVRTPHAVDRTPRRDASGTPVAGPSSATLINRTVTRSENKTEVVHHRTSFEQPVSKVLRKDADGPAAREAAAGATGATTTNPPAVRAMPAAPAIDVERLSDEVYRHIQRRVRIERERRGA